MLRPAVVADAERLARVVIEGFEVYREFAPPGWEPPPAEDEIERAEETTWCLLAESEGRVVGQVTFLPAARAALPVGEPKLAHLRNPSSTARYGAAGSRAAGCRQATSSTRKVRTS